MFYSWRFRNQLRYKKEAIRHVNCNWYRKKSINLQNKLREGLFQNGRNNKHGRERVPLCGHCWLVRVTPKNSYGVNKQSTLRT
jgi:hypothetical protein